MPKSARVGQAKTPSPATSSSSWPGAATSSESPDCSPVKDPPPWDAGRSPDASNWPVDVGASGDAGEPADAGPVCLPDPYKLGLEEKTYFGQGCSAASDQAVLQALNSEPTKDAALRKVIFDCLLIKGCSGKGDYKTAAGVKVIEQCTSACLLKSTAEPMGASCARCFGVHGTCQFVKCLAKCAADPGSDGCKSCLACNCDPMFAACKKASGQ